MLFDSTMVMRPRHKRLVELIRYDEPSYADVRYRWHAPGSRRFLLCRGNRIPAKSGSPPLMVEVSPSIKPVSRKTDRSWQILITLPGLQKRR